MSGRDFEVIVWGATGFTGRLVAEYLAGQYGSTLRWAMAGRSESRLEQVRAEIGAGDVPLLLADSDDVAAMERLAARASVICTTVGPYARYGEKLVAACAAHGTGYCDLAGEVPWIRRMIDRYSDDAAASGARIVNCCGFDSVPSDMGTWFLQQSAGERFGSPLASISMRLRAAKGGLSGGTYASLSGVLAEAAADPEVRRVLRDPYGLNPADTPRGPDVPDLDRVVFDADFDAWSSPFVMASINTRIVRRSHALAGLPWGEHFHYNEALLTGRGAGAWARAWGNALTLGVVTRSRPGGTV
ncbi:MAG: saccharopine dehydrogenase, partial [Gammaproteobacteria bacterium]|nr:saccharopine dehydrogenase [Gammaproteobacteria bacterium]